MMVGFSSRISVNVAPLTLLYMTIVCVALVVAASKAEAKDISRGCNPADILAKKSVEDIAEYLIQNSVEVIEGETLLTKWSNQNLIISYQFLADDHDGQLEKKIRDYFTSELNRSFSSFGFSFREATQKTDRIDVAVTLLGIGDYSLDAYGLNTPYRDDWGKDFYSHTYGRQVFENSLIKYLSKNGEYLGLGFVVWSDELSYHTDIQNYVEENFGKIVGFHDDKKAGFGEYCALLQLLYDLNIGAGPVTKGIEREIIKSLKDQWDQSK